MALVSIGRHVGLVWPPTFPEVSSVSYGSSSYTLDRAEADEKFAAVGFIPATGTCTDIAFYTGTITTGDTLNVGIYNIDGSTGNPDTASVYVASSTGSVVIASGDDNVIKECQINGGTGVTVTLGDQVAIVFGWNSATGNGAVIRYRSGSALGYGNGNTYFDDYQTPTWTRGAGAVGVSLKIGGTWYALVGHHEPMSSATISGNWNTGWDIGSRIYLPFAARAYGMATAGVSQYTGTTLTGHIWSDPEGVSPTEVAVSDAHDCDNGIGLGAERELVLIFQTPVELSANTAYCMSITGTRNATSYVSGATVNATYADARRGGSGVYQYSRTDTGDFTPLTTQVVFMYVLLDQIHDGAGGGGGGIRLAGAGGLAG